MPLSNMKLLGETMQISWTRSCKKQLWEDLDLRNKFNCFKSNENWEEFTKQRKLCTKIECEAKISHFDLWKNPRANEFWKRVKYFLTDKRHCTTENYWFIKDEKKISNLFNDFFVNIIERSACQKPKAASHTLEEIIATYKDHPSKKSIKEQ